MLVNYLKEASSFVGIPYQAHGRSRNGVDCYGLAMLFYLHCTGEELPDCEYNVSNSAEQSLVIQRASFREQFKKAEIPAPLDLVLMEYYGSPSHIGIYVGNSYVLHASQKSAVILSNLTDTVGFRTMKDRVEGYYRWIYGSLHTRTYSVPPES